MFYFFISSHALLNNGYILRNMLGNSDTVQTSQTVLIQTYYTPSLGSIVQPTAPRLQTCMACYYNE